MSESSRLERLRTNKDFVSLCARRPSGLRGGPAHRGWLIPVMGLAATSLAPAQDAFRNSLAGNAAADAVQALALTVKSGDFRLQVASSLAMDWNDNINLTKTDPEADVILRPGISIGATYPFGKRNLLNLDVNFGYSKYLQHDEFSQWYVGSQSGSGLSFDLAIKDFTINFHDRFNTTQDAAQASAVAGTGTYGTFDNTVGLTGTWDLNAVTVTLGYDHQNIISLFDQSNSGMGGTSSTNSLGSANSIDHSSELFVTRVGVRAFPRLTAGVEGTASFTTYDQPVLNDNNNYSVGVFGDWRAGSYFRVQPRFGYTIFDYSQTSTAIQAGNVSSWYADLTLTHQATDYLNYSLSAGHGTGGGIQSDALETYYLRPSANWNVFKNVTLQTSLFYEHGAEAGGQLASLLESNYDWYGCALALSYSPMKKIRIGLNYRFTMRSSNVASGEYAQNMVGLQITYAPQ